MDEATQNPVNESQESGAASGQLAFPLKLGAEQVAEAAWAKLPRGERELIARLSAFSLSERFWEAYRTLRAQGYKTLDATVGAWKVTGAQGRGALRTLKSLAEALGTHRHTIYHAAERVDAAVQPMVMAWLAERVPDVDEALYHAAVGVFGTAADRKLFYQRARVPLSGEESEPVDNWAAVLEQARKDAEAAKAAGQGESTK